MNSISNLCKRRRIRSLDIPTPLLIPSFSSKNISDIGEIWEYLRGQFHDVVLLSAYDLFYGYISLPRQGADVVFIDCGGYEAIAEFDASDIVQMPYQPQPWDSEKLRLALERVDTLSALVLVSLDHPNQDLQPQINQAKEFFAQCLGCATDFLLKPYQMPFINPETIAKHADELNEFDILGITEKELGGTIQDRILNLANLREALDRKALEIPIHIFGCLDPISTWLYYLCGADIFDGLTWLRYVFYNNMPVYRNSWAIKNRLLTYDEINLKALAWQHNISALNAQQRLMSEFASKSAVELLPDGILTTIESVGIHND